MDLLKKYSTIDEVLAFLKDKTGYDYSLKDIRELEIEGKINIFLYLERVRVRIEEVQPDGEVKYEFYHVGLRAIYKKRFNGPILMASDTFHYEDVMASVEGPLKVHELLEEYRLDKAPFNPISYDEDNVYFSEFKFFDPQEDIIKHLRFNSDEIKSLVNYEAKSQSIIEHLQSEIKRLEKELEEYRKTKPVYEQGYLDPNNKFYSIEMKLCHDTWNKLYKDGVKPRLAHTREVRNYLENYPDLEVNSKAVRRIATITNPKAVLAKSDLDKEDLS